jgi:fibronectin type 3 domain-containing protein
LALVGRGPAKKFVDLTWAPNVDKDLTAYKIYRREEGMEMALIHTGRTSFLSFQDAEVTAGHTYFYCLSAVDTNGNESAKSAEVKARVP